MGKSRSAPEPGDGGVRYRVQNGHLGGKGQEKQKRKRKVTPKANGEKESGRGERREGITGWWSGGRRSKWVAPPFAFLGENRAGEDDDEDERRKAKTKESEGP